MINRKSNIFLIVIWGWRIILLAIFLCFFLWLFWQNLAASGYFAIGKDFCRDASLPSTPTLSIGQTDFFDSFYPVGRVSNIEVDERGRCFQRLMGEPVYFKAKMPRSFERVRAKIFYQNDDQPLFELGLMKNSQGSVEWQFQLKPLENQIFDQLGWYKISQGGITVHITLWQKKEKFETIQQFVNNLPANEKVATFHYELAPEAVKDPTKVIVWNYKTPMQYVDYVIAQYQPPQREGDLKIATADFLIAPEFAFDHQLEFIVSAPGLAREQTNVRIYKIEMELERGGLTQQNLKEIFKTLGRRLIKKISQ